MICAGGVFQAICLPMISSRRHRSVKRGEGSTFVPSPVDGAASDLHAVQKAADRVQRLRDVLQIDVGVLRRVDLRHRRHVDLRAGEGEAADGVGVDAVVLEDARAANDGAHFSAAEFFADCEVVDLQHDGSPNECVVWDETSYQTATPPSRLPTEESDLVMFFTSTSVCCEASTCVTGATLVCGLAKAKPLIELALMPLFWKMLAPPTMATISARPSSLLTARFSIFNMMVLLDWVGWLSINRCARSYICEGCARQSWKLDRISLMR
ncbi:protein of unknown function (plasmid) [Caballeronia sp. S22]